MNSGAEIDLPEDGRLHTELVCGLIDRYRQLWKHDAT